MESKKSFIIPQCAQCSSQKLSVFACLPAEELSDITSAKSCNYYRKGQTIFFEGNNSHGIYCVHKGKIKMHKLGLDGKEQIIRFAKDGDIIGYRALLSGEGYSLSATVLEDSSVCYIPKDTIVNLIIQDAKFALKVMELACKEIGKATDTITKLAQKPVRERLAEVLLILKQTFGEKADGTIDITLTREEIASLVGTATESCIRILSEFKRDGLIQLDGKKIQILNAKQLMKEGNLYE